MLRVSAPYVWFETKGEENEKSNHSFQFLSCKMTTQSLFMHFFVIHFS